MNILIALRKVSETIPIVFPVHPRTGNRLKRFERILTGSNILRIPPLGYLNFLNLMINAKFVLTDSGGIQEETTALKIPCLTLRQNTERPITVWHGTNTIVGTNQKKIFSESMKIIKGKYKSGRIPPLWDGKTSKRLIKILMYQKSR